MTVSREPADAVATCWSTQSLCHGVLRTVAALGLVEWRVVLSNCKCDDKPKVITCSTLRDADCADAISGVRKLGESETKTMRQVE